MLCRLVLENEWDSVFAITATERISIFSLVLSVFTQDRVAGATDR